MGAGPVINETGIIGQVILGITANVTGNLFLTMLLILIVFLLVGFAFRAPMEWQAVYLLPLFIAFMAYSAEFLAVGGVVLMFLGAILAKNFMKI